MISLSSRGATRGSCLSPRPGRSVPSLGTEAQSFGLLDPKLCYLLDGILFIYGIIITALFLRAKVGVQRGLGLAKFQACAIP